MTTSTHNVFPKLTDLATWLSRNCEKCRWRKQPGGFPDPDSICTLPGDIFLARVRNAPFKKHWSVIINGPAFLTHPQLYKTPPYKCRSFKSTRGRPTTVDHLK